MYFRDRSRLALKADKFAVPNPEGRTEFSPRIFPGLRFDLAQHFHFPRTADYAHALTIIAPITTFEQEDRVAERRHCRDTPAANAAVDDVLRAVRVDAHNLTDIGKGSIDAFKVIGCDAPNSRRSSGVPDLRVD